MRNETKKTAKFTVNGVQIAIDLYRREESDGSHLSITGEIAGSFGQNRDSIARLPATCRT
jgi:hypothetical protein